MLNRSLKEWVAIVWLATLTSLMLSVIIAMAGVKLIAIIVLGFAIMMVTIWAIDILDL